MFRAAGNNAFFSYAFFPGARAYEYDAWHSNVQTVDSPSPRAAIKSSSSVRADVPQLPKNNAIRYDSILPRADPAPKLMFVFLYSIIITLINTKSEIQQTS